MVKKGHSLKTLHGIIYDYILNTCCSFYIIVYIMYISVFCITFFCYLFHVCYDGYAYVFSLCVWSCARLFTSIGHV